MGHSEGEEKNGNVERERESVCVVCCLKFLTTLFERERERERKKEKERGGRERKNHAEMTADFIYTFTFIYIPVFV